MASDSAKGPAWQPSESVETELDRVGVSYRKAGPRGYVHAYQLEQLHLEGPPHERPRRSWRGSEHDVVTFLAGLADDVGVDPSGRRSHPRRAKDEP